MESRMNFFTCSADEWRRSLRSIKGIIEISTVDCANTNEGAYSLAAADSKAVARYGHASESSERIQTTLIATLPDRGRGPFPKGTPKRRSTVPGKRSGGELPCHSIAVTSPPWPV